MKKCSYDLAIKLITITFVIFSTQLLLEISKIITRKPGLEYTTHFCGIAFVLCCIYGGVLILLNVSKR